jgi:hypothetical protein
MCALVVVGCVDSTTQESSNPSAITAATCIASGTDAAINAALVGSSTSVALCQDAVFDLDHPIKFTAAGQTLATQGLPTGPHRALLRIHSSTLSKAIDGNGQSGITIENVIVDGNRPNLGYLDGDALIEIGGAGSNQTVQHIHARNTRSWSTIHIFEGTVTNDVPQCQNAQILSNTIGPAGDDNPSLGQWADGISLACGNSTVSYNTVTDATDGAIVVFGAPGSFITSNTVVANTRTLLGGINMVDYAPVHGNYTGTFVESNTIDANTAYIKVALGMGLAIWTCPSWSDVNRGGAVIDNVLEGQNMGYGYVVNNVTNWSVLGNVDQSRHVGKVAAQCGGLTSPPGGFQYEVVGDTDLQPEFQPAALTAVLGVTEPAILRAATTPTACTDMFGGQGLYPNQSISSCDGRFDLVLQSDGNLVLYQGTTPLWASNTVGRNSAEAIMQDDGNFVLYDATGAPIWASNTQGYPGAYLAVQNDGNLVVYSATNAPLWASNTCCY